MVTTTLTVLMSFGGKEEFEISPSTTTLSQIKDLISQSDALGYVPVDDQRIFYMGRELKTGGRTLEKLLGDAAQQYGINTIHVHSKSGRHDNNSKKQKCAKKASASAATNAASNGKSSRRRRNQRQRQQQPPQQEEVILLDDEDDAPPPAAPPAGNNNDSKDVIDLLDDSDDDEVEVEVQPQHQRRAKRRRV